MKTKKLRARIVTIALVFAMVLSIAPTMAFAKNESTVNPVKDGKMAFDFNVDYNTMRDYFANITLNGEYLDSDMFEDDDYTWKEIPAGTTVSINVNGSSFEVKILDVDNN